MAITNRRIRENLAKVQKSLALQGGAIHHVSGHFARDCVPIVAFAQRSPDNWARVATFVLLTMRQSFITMARQMTDTDRDGSASKWLYGWKRDSFRAIHESKLALHAESLRFARGEIDLDSLILAYLALPGFGIVKASFLCQMTVADGACLDVHNLDRMGLRLDAFNCSKTLTVATIRARIAAYNRIWAAQGDSAYWWDSWCNYVAVRRRKWFPYGGAQCSAIHPDVILTAERNPLKGVNEHSRNPARRNRNRVRN
jgi:hypothetical protein